MTTMMKAMMVMAMMMVTMAIMTMMTRMTIAMIILYLYIYMYKYYIHHFYDNVNHDDVPCYKSVLQISAGISIFRSWLHQPDSGWLKC